MKNIMKGLVLGCAVLASACGGQQAGDINDRYPMPWREANGKETAALGEVIKKKAIGLCSKYKVRPADGVPGEYLVACSADGANWNYYVINAVVGESVGPITDSALVKPLADSEFLHR